ncbi:MAG: hypothetical protein WD009_06380 [Phycisphaeraceae bacterium]
MGDEVVGDGGQVGEGRVELLEGELVEARRTIERLERRARIDALLTESEAVDLEAARLLTECAVEQMDEPDVSAAVEELRRHRPYLFRRRVGGVGGVGGAGVMAAREEEDGGAATHAAAEAAASGDRRDLLRYLRLRRRR